ncbi:Type IV pilus biogenesis protein PilE [Vibrio chagasii]|uniref:type IV pilin protein n=2 Tax=Vibrionaceae TaxID=641 RepID=UPI000CF4B2CA|nr:MULTISPECIES: type IV pilin protein [Vibrio]CAH6794615.1 Type IV pilus biogenesis protein PilE [Vibrio chagasii]NOI97037.1 prepilin-type N-terminal cleavage/methylation domain-containing protein [Vibrio sp. T3Y01]PQJ48098.1 prepilin-type N-terminal cleavage/methylation domain-containing protein [Vibrio splendidus]CAH6801205.1 Type IV pilus biogenesis protein PilE [Vibrio chagasii]CAH6806404.1 Type IV pilus biogenesis protein PilE [Vibrio chagasii]
MIRKNICNSNNISMRGMTLIELLLAVVIMGILGAIAYPSYTNHVMKAHRVNALADMTKIQLELETLYTDDYESAAQGIISAGTCSFCDTDTSRYTLAISASSTTYIIQAEPHAPQTNDDCLDSTTDILELHHSGISEPEACWK